MAHQNLFEALERITGFIALESDMSEIIDAVDKDRAEQNKPIDMKKTMTAVEWLEEEFIKLEATTGVHGKMYELINQAKEMEKDKAFEFWQGGINCTEEGGKSFEEYYTETYGE